MGSDLAHASTDPPAPSRIIALCSLSWSMTYVIAGSCIKDDSCIEVCPVDCIHPKPGDPDFEAAEQLYIDPELCIDCDACVEACPVDAIFADFEIPEKYDYALELNAEFFGAASGDRGSSWPPARSCCPRPLPKPLTYRLSRDAARVS